MNWSTSTTAKEIEVEGSYTQDPNDAAAEFERAINSFYIQDEWQVNDSLMVIAGIRFDCGGRAVSSHACDVAS